MIRYRKERECREINAGSMADIAFLLLIFFLVTTTISAEKGILVKLPPYQEEFIQPNEQNPRNILSVKVNKNNDLWVEGKEEDITALKALTKFFLLNYGKDKTLSDHPRVAVVSLQNDRTTSYEMYIAVYNELKAAYHEVRQEKSLEKYKRDYKQLNEQQQAMIRKAIPIKISEAEPVKY